MAVPMASRKPFKKRILRKEITGYILAFVGILALVLSIVYGSSILAFIGLGLTFWGLLLSYLTRERYVKSSLLASTATPSLENLGRLVTELDFKGKAVYLPPKYLSDFKSGILYIPKRHEVAVPPVGAVSEETAFSRNPNALCIAPSGLALTNLFEKELGTDFVRVDLQYLQDNLPKIIIENLEIAQDIEINKEDDLIQVKLIDPIYRDSCKETREFPEICSSIDCPLCSSIACALSRTTGKPITIEKTECSDDGKTISVQYRILEE